MYHCDRACETKSGVASAESGVNSAESGVRKEEWSGFGGEWSDFGGEWSAKRRVEWFRRGSINVEWSVIGEVGSCTAPYDPSVARLARLPGVRCEAGKRAAGLTGNNCHAASVTAVTVDDAAVDGCITRRLDDFFMPRMSLQTPQL
jgi:hypothetical protein